MKRGEVRFCDVCGRVIVKAEKYLVSKVPRTNVRLFLEMMQIKSETAHTTLDSEGNLRLEICLDCHIRMDRSDNETVN